MKKYVISLIIISSLFINTIIVSAVSSRVIYNFTQYSETKGEIELAWNVQDSKDEIQVISYYLTKDNVLEVTYRVGDNIPEGFNKRTIDGISFPIRIILKKQKVEQDVLTDLPEDKVNRYDILNLYDRGIINGYEDNSFKPNNNVVRAEFFAMLAATAGFEIDTESESIFKDVDNNFWGKKYIMTLANKGIISGNGNGICNPKGDITIGEVLKIIDKTFRFHDESSSYKNPIVNHWSNENFVNMAKAHIVRDIDAFYSPYKPNTKATRQQCATLLSRALQTNYTIK
ncbi:hypothetical protein AN1V17_20960 [Vallitalea sediminicola]